MLQITLIQTGDGRVKKKSFKLLLFCKNESVAIPVTVSPLISTNKNELANESKTFEQKQKQKPKKFF